MRDAAERIPGEAGLDPALVRRLAAVVGPDGVITEPGRLLPWESDALPRFRQLPRAVVLPRDTAEAAEAVRVLAGEGIPLTPRGAGTGLSGGAVAAPGGVLVGTSRMNRILSLDAGRRLARVQAGVINTDLSRAAAPFGLHYAPDPSSQTACTLGGNVGENAGGPHCLKYGVTTRYVSGLTVVTGEGEVVELGGADRCDRLDLTGLFVGSEGLLGLATELELRLIPRARGVRTFLAVFPSTEAAGTAVSAIIADGLLPAAMEIMDRGTIQAVEASIFAAGYPTDAGAVLVVEFDGTEAGLDPEAERARALCAQAGASELRSARTEAERQALWQGRKKAYGAFGRLTPDLLVQDATVPRSALPRVLARITEIGEEHRLRVANVFHAGDGNLHPKILFDRRDPEEVERVERASKEMMQVCVEAGGTITGEHGVGLDKRGYMHLVHGPEELAVMRGVQRVFDPRGLWNPGKVLPEEGGGGDGGGGRGETRVGRGGPAAVGADEEGAGLPEEIRHDPADLTVTVGAGCSLGRLQEALAREGQWLPLDPPGRWEDPVGVVVGAGAWGPLAPALGRVRDLLLGAELTTPDGRRLRLGGRVMKNVAGLDLVRAVAGSRGRWGRITSCTFRLLPLPGAHRVLAWEGSHTAMEALARRLAEHPVLPASLVMLRTDDTSRVLVRLLGSPATVAAEGDELEALAPGAERWETTPSGAAFLGADPVAEALDALHRSALPSGRLTEFRPGTLSRGELAERLAGLAVGGRVCHLPLWDVWWVGVDDTRSGVREVVEAVRRAGGDVCGPGAVDPGGGSAALRALEEGVCRVFDPGADGMGSP